MMQNHDVISSKYHFWTRNVPNWTKSPDLVMSGPVQKDPYGPIRAHVGPYGPQPGPGPNPDWAPTRTGLTQSSQASSFLTSIRRFLMVLMFSSVSGRTTCENSYKITSKSKFSIHVVQIPYHLHPALSYSLYF